MKQIEVQRVKYCLFCQNNIKAKVRFNKFSVIQSCPICKKELSRFGLFFTEYSDIGNVKVKIIVK